jgi:hypothetical protein
MSTLNDQFILNKIKSSKSKYSIEVVNNWYKSLYAWNLVQNQAYKPLISTSSSSSSSNQFNNLSLNEDQNSSQIDSNQQNITIINETYKIPSLGRRFMAEGFDAIYVQLFKIMILFSILSYTDLM